MTGLLCTSRSVNKCIMRRIFIASIPVFLCLSALAQQSPRLTGLSFYESANGQPALVDSAAFKYQGASGAYTGINKQLYWDNLLVEDGRQSGKWLYDTVTIWAPDAGAGGWIRDRHYQQAFENNGLIVSNTLIQHVPMPLSPAFEGQTDSFFYDQSGRLVQWIILQDETGISWHYDHRYSYGYDPSGNLTSTLTEYWQNGQWHNERRALYSYDPSNRLIAGTYDEWQSSQWRPYVLEKYEYDAGGYLTIKSWKIWSSFTSNWFLFFRDVYTYTPAGDMEMDTYQQSDSSQQVWTDEGRKLYSYDTVHNRLSTTEQGNGFVNAWKWEWTYNLANLPATKNKYKWEQGAWDHVELYNYYYDIQPSLVRPGGLMDVSVRLFPSPASSYVSLEIKSEKPRSLALSMFDEQGRVVWQGRDKVAGVLSMHIPVAHLAAGSYFLSVSGAGGRICRQFTVVH
jgi:hypothetical protein